MMLCDLAALQREDAILAHAAARQVPLVSTASLRHCALSEVSNTFNTSAEKVSRKIAAKLAYHKVCLTETIRKDNEPYINPHTPT